MVAAIQRRLGNALGWMMPTAIATSTGSLNAAATWQAVGFTPDQARTLSEIRVYLSAVAGTLGAGDITASLYDSTGTSGAPGSAIESGKLPTATITAAGYYDFTGFTTALTAGLLYWIVFKNGNGTPASNNCTFRRLTTGVQAYPHLFGATGVNGSAGRHGWYVTTTSNSGGAWTLQPTQCLVRVKYADGNYDGFVLNNVAISAAGDGVYSNRELGVKFTAPRGAPLRVAGLAMMLGTKSGTPTGAARFGLWVGDSPPVNLGYTNSFGTIAAIVASWYYAYFPDTVGDNGILTVQPGSTVRVTCGEAANSDASSVRYNLMEFAGDTDAGSVLLLPWNGTAQKTLYDGSGWNDATLGASLYGHALLLDQSQDFARRPSGIYVPGF